MSRKQPRYAPYASRLSNLLTAWPLQGLEPKLITSCFDKAQ